MANMQSEEDRKSSWKVVVRIAFDLGFAISLVIFGLYLYHITTPR